MAIHNFRKLEIWKESMKLTKMTYSVTAELPSDELYGIKSQLNRASVSVPSNIAEGSARTTNLDFNRFLSISLGSAFELETQLILVQELFGFDCSESILQCQLVQRKIHNFKNALGFNS